MYRLCKVDKVQLNYLCSLEIRRITNDLIMCFKIQTNWLSQNVNECFTLSPSVTYTMQKKVAVMMLKSLLLLLFIRSSSSYLHYQYL